MMPDEKWFFTFGDNHVHPLTGESLGSRYVVLTGTFSSTRNRMIQRFGNRWANQYNYAEYAARIVEFELEELEVINAQGIANRIEGLERRHSGMPADVAYDQAVKLLLEAVPKPVRQAFKALSATLTGL